MSLSDDGIDFDQLARLARDDPERFEQVRALLIERAIVGLPEGQRQRIRALQWRIDQTRRLAPTPQAANHTLSEMMWGALDRLADLLNGEAQTKRAPVLPFQPPPRD